MDGLLSAARTATDAKARKAKFAELQKELVDRLPFLPLFLEDRVELADERLQGPTPRLISRRVGPILGCANMAPRRDTRSVMLACPVPSVPRWRNRQTR